MRTFFRTVFVVLLFGGWGLSAASLHVIRAPGRLIVVPKDHLSFSEVYVDTRPWTLDDVAQHPTVVKRLLDRGKADALQHVAADVSGEKLVEKLHAAVDHAPPATQTAVTIRLER